MVVGGDELGDARDHGSQHQQDAEEGEVAGLGPLRGGDPPEEERGEEDGDGAQERHRPRGGHVLDDRGVEGELVDGRHLGR